MTTTSKLQLAALVAVVAFSFGLGRSCAGWRAEQKIATTPYAPPPANEVKEAPAVTAELPVATIQPTEMQRAKIGQKHRRAVGRSLTKEEQKLTGPALRQALEHAGEQILSDVSVRASQTPQDVLTTVNPATGAVTISVVADRRRWLGLRGNWELGLEALRAVPVDPNRALDGRVWVAAEPLRLGHWNFGGSLAYESRGEGGLLIGLRAVRRP